MVSSPRAEPSRDDDGGASVRILMVTDFYPPIIGGVEIAVRDLSVELVARGHSVAVATLRVPGEGGRSTDDGVSVYRIPGLAQSMSWLYGQPRPWAPPVPDPRVVAALARVIRAERPDVVHGHDWLARSALPLRARAGSAFVMSLHYYTRSCAKKSLVYEESPCSGPGPLKCLRCAAGHYGSWKGPAVTLGNWAAALAERRAVDLFLPVSRAAAAGNGLTRSSLPYEVIPNMVRDVPIEGDVADDPRLPLLPQEPFMLFVGNLHPYKGVDVLVEAYRRLDAPPPLVLIGKPSPAMPLAEPGVTILLDWPHALVQEAWRRALVGVLPSTWPEPFGLVLTEAMNAGRPVVASSVGGIPEVVGHGTSGLLVPPGDPRALADALDRVTRDGELRERLSAGALARVRELRPARVVPRVEAAYARALRGAAAAEATTG